MAKLVQDIAFIPGSGLNSDNTLRFIPIGDSPYRLHITPVGEGENGVLTNMKGCEQVVIPANSLIEFTTSDVYSVVGSFYNATLRACYYFIHSLPYDSGGGVYLYDNKLLRYNTDTETVDLLFLDTGNYLGLSYDTMMKDIRMIETWLFFNPKGTEPKMIDVVMAYNYTHTDTYAPASTYSTGNLVKFYGGVFVATAAVAAGYTPSTHTSLWRRVGDAYGAGTYFGQDEFDFCFDVIKQPPVKRLSFEYGSEPYYAAGYGANNVRGRVFKFAYRYQYFDNAYSVFSAHSAPSLPPDGEVYNGEIVGISTTNNHITFQIPLGLPAIIKSVDLAFQEGESDWKIATSIDRQSQSLLDDLVQEYNFYNNEVYNSIDNTLPEIVYHAVPREAGAQEVINLNTLVYGRCKEGFNSLAKEEMDVVLTPVAVKLEESYEIGTLHRDNGTVSGDTGTDYFTAEIEPGDEFGYPDRYNSMLSLDGASTLLTAGDIFSITLNGIKYTYPVVAGDIDDDELLAEGLVAYILSATPFSAFITELVGGWYLGFQDFEYYPQVSECFFYTPLSSVATLAKQSGFKTGAEHPFCIFYYDENLRRGDANISDGSTVYVPQFVEDTDVDGTNFKYAIEWEVDHTPPSWARYWRWGKAENSLTSFFVQYTISAYGNEGSFSYFDITPLQTLKTTDETNWNQFPNSIIDEYVWEKGDRVRIITAANNPAGTDPLGALVDRIYDYEILKYDDTTNYIYIQKQIAPSAVGENSLIEIYRPKKGTSVDLYYEFGPILPIIEDSVGERVHKGITQDQDTDAEVPATGTFTTGDVFHIIRTPSKYLLNNNFTVGVFHESMHYSDFYTSDYWDKGKAGFVSRIGEQTLNIIRYSNTYVQGTQLNGLTAFDPLKLREINDLYGNIRAIREVGDTLKVYQDTKASSILIGKQEYVDSRGNEQVMTSDRTLGSIRYSPSAYGTVFAESITKNNRYIYGFDIYNGVMFRDSANGIFPISGRFESTDGRGSYKMETYFKAKSKALLASGVANVRVYTLWDEEYGLLYVTFIDRANADNNETILFHEGSNRWVTFADLTKVDTWNEFLFPTYMVVRGFESGLEPFYDGSDGYTYFTLESSSNASVFASTPEYEIEVLQATVRTSPNASPDDLEVEIEILSPTIVITEVDLFPYSFTWPAAQSGVAYKIDLYIVATLNGGPSTAIITAKPSWLTVRRGALTIGVGDTVTPEDILTVFPATVNTGVLRTGLFTIQDSSGNTESTTFTQSATTGVTVTVIEDRVEEPFFLLSKSGTAAAGSATVNITFTPDNSLHSSGETFDVYYRITKNGAPAGDGTFTGTDEQSNTEALTMTSVAAGGDVIMVYLGNGTF